MNKIKKLFNKIFRRGSVVPEMGYEFAGHRFRVLDPAKMPKIRQAAFFLGENDREWGISKDNLIELFGVIIKECEFPDNFANKDDLIKQQNDKLSDVRAMSTMIRDVIVEDFQFAPFLKAATHVILVDDEPEGKIDEKYYDLKINLCKRHDEILLFFYQIIRGFQIGITSSFDTSELWESFPTQPRRTPENVLLKRIEKDIFSDMVSPRMNITSNETSH